MNLQCPLGEVLKGEVRAMARGTWDGSIYWGGGNPWDCA